MRHLTTLPSRLFLILLCYLPSLDVSAKATIYENITELKQLQTHLAKASHQPAQTLIVFDIDDTLLEASNFVGGDSWYNWQRGRSIESTSGEMIKIDKKDKFSCIFSKLGVLYELGSYHVTEPTAPAIVTKLQQSYDLLALTSRSPDYRAGTRRELQKAKIRFEKSHLLPATSSLNYHFDDGNGARAITYQNGIAMTTGLNKGLVLDDLLRRLDRQYDVIYFIDDSRKNVDNMFAAWQSKSTLVNIYHYTGVDKRISPQDIEQSRFAKKEFNDFLKATFPNKFAAFTENRCD